MWYWITITSDNNWVWKRGNYHNKYHEVLAYLQNSFLNFTILKTIFRQQIGLHGFYILTSVTSPFLWLKCPRTRAYQHFLLELIFSTVYFSSSELLAQLTILKKHFQTNTPGMFAEKSNNIRAKLQLNFASRLSTWFRKVRKYNDQILAKKPQIWPKNTNIWKK